MDGRIALIAGVALIIVGVAFAQAHPWQGINGYGNYSMGFHAPGLNASERQAFNETARPRFNESARPAFNATLMEEHFQEMLAQVNDSSLREFMQERHDLMLKVIDGTATEEESIALGGPHRGFGASGCPMQGFDGNRPREAAPGAKGFRGRGMTR